MAKKPHTPDQDPEAQVEPRQPIFDDQELDREPALIEVSLEELEELSRKRSHELELEVEGRVETQHSDGSAYYPLEADQQGLVYTPPDDPPVLPSATPQGVEMGSGFGKAMEDDDDPRAEILPRRVRNDDADLEEKVIESLRKNGETANMTDIRVRVRNGVVYLSGTVETLDDIDVVGYLVQDIDGVVDVEEELQVAIM